MDVQQLGDAVAVVAAMRDLAGARTSAVFDFVCLIGNFAAQLRSQCLLEIRKVQPQAASQAVQILNPNPSTFSWRHLPEQHREHHLEMRALRVLAEWCCK